MSLILDSHRKYVSDRPRVAAFQRAIEEVVQPGDVVVDLGSGTGMLGLLACRAGARKVYSIDGGGIIGLARKIAADNGYTDRIEFIRGLSTRVELPEKADVIVTDQIGRMGFEAGVMQYLADGIRRFLRPGGKLVPSAMQLWTAPVTCLEMWNNCEFWNHPVAGFNFRAAREIAGNTGYPLTYDPRQLLSAPACTASADLHHPTPESWTGQAAFEIEREDILHGIGGWFQARLSPSVMLTNSPLAADRINRRNVFLPIDRPQLVHPGDRVAVKLRIVPEEVTASWHVTVETGVRSGKPQTKRFAQSTLLGMLISKEDLGSTQPDTVPTLTPWGIARRTIVNLIDGKRPLREIEQAVLREHPDLFPSLKQAAVFVAEVVTRYTV